MKSRTLADNVAQLQIWSNCALRSGWSAPSRVFLLACRPKPSFFSRRPTSFCPATKPRAANAADKCRWLLLTQRSGASGSPRIEGSTKSFNASKSPGCVSVAGLLPPPGLRTRAPNDAQPRPKSIKPRPIVLRAIPVATDTAAIPPRPAARASPAAKRRRSRSVRKGSRASKRDLMAVISTIPEM